MIELNALRGVLESLLFVADRPLTTVQLAETAEADAGTVARVLAELAEEYRQSGRGFQLREVAEGWRFYTHPAYAHYVERLVRSPNYRRLTQAALETLAIVAYKQPANRADVSAIRGVNSESAMHSLMEMGLIAEVGRGDGAGRPFLYGTTPRFLEVLGLPSVAELPSIEDFEPDEETRRRIAERLSASAQEPTADEPAPVEPTADEPAAEGSAAAGGETWGEDDDEGESRG